MEGSSQREGSLSLGVTGPTPSDSGTAEALTGRGSCHPTGEGETGALWDPEAPALAREPSVLPGSRSL